VAKHYTAIVEILEIQQVIGSRDSSGGKEKTEVARIVVRADTLEELRTKVGKHIELV
jgi:hypothetical protein